MARPVKPPTVSALPSKAQAVRKRSKTPALSIAYPSACGIDIGATSHFVAVPGDRDDEPVREFLSFTADLERLVQWLHECRVTGFTPFLRIHL